jgi:hypothetical protein
VALTVQQNPVRSDKGKRDLLRLALLFGIEMIPKRVTNRVQGHILGISGDGVDLAMMFISVDQRDF